MANSHLQILCFILCFTSFGLTTTAKNQNKLALRLIHHNSIVSPFYNPKTTTENNATMTDEGSFPSDDIRAPLSPEPPPGTSFLVNISIGEPPVPQLLVMDTGSALTWICTNCKPQWNPLYVPKQSSTYKSIPCFYQYDCSKFFDYKVTQCLEKQCAYRTNYSDHSSSQGLLATEKFTFETSSEGIAEVSDVLFGNALDNRGNVAILSGVLGLGRRDMPHPLVSRVGNKFSYCIGNISDPYYMYNQLILGDGAIFEGSSTPMKSTDNNYAVKIEGISVGQKQLTIDQEEFDYNVAIDSGSAITMLQRSGFDALKGEVEALMKDVLEPVHVDNRGESPCYRGNLVRDLKGFPLVSLYFAGGTQLDLSVEGLFQRVDDNTFCMAVDVSKDDMNILGVLAQQYYNVGFDLDAMKISFQYIDCQLLDE